MCRALAIAVLWVLTAPTAHAVLGCTADGTAYCREAGGLSGRALTPAGPMTLADRFRGRAPSNSRIDRAVSGYITMGA